MDLSENSAWRQSREPGWYRDIGYLMQTVLADHRYDYDHKGIRPDDPGWHECTCRGWEGYWSTFHPHVADQLRATVLRWADMSKIHPHEAARAAPFCDDCPDHEACSQGCPCEIAKRYA